MTEELQMRRDQVDQLMQWIDEIDVALGPGLIFRIGQEGRLKQIAELRSTLTPGARWTLPDGTEMVAVPVNPSLDALKASYEAGFDAPPWTGEQAVMVGAMWDAVIAAASEPGASAQASDEARDNGRIGDAKHEDDELARDPLTAPDTAL